MLSYLEMPADDKSRKSIDDLQALIERAENLISESQQQIQVMRELLKQSKRLHRRDPLKTYPKSVDSEEEK